MRDDVARQCHAHTTTRIYVHMYDNYTIRAMYLPGPVQIYFGARRVSVKLIYRYDGVIRLRFSLGPVDVFLKYNVLSVLRCFTLFCP